MIGLIPASGSASRMGGLPKFALPCDENNLTLLQRNVDLMKTVTTKIIVCTTQKWVTLIDSLNLDIELEIESTSTMNSAILSMVSRHDSDKYLVGMSDIYYLGENPYIRLSESIIDYEFSVACWKLDSDLKGRVGQVKMTDNQLEDLVDKNPSCAYKFMWGALAFKREIIQTIDPKNPHIGIDLLSFIKKSNHFAFEVQGKYFDIGTMSSYKRLLNTLID